MARSVNSDPLLSHNFALIDVPVAGILPTAFPIKTIQSAVDNGTFVGVKSIDIPEMQVEVKGIRELNDPFVHSIPTGYTTTGDATIEMAIFNTSLDMYLWFMQVVRGWVAPRRSLIVVQTRNNKLIPQRLILLKHCVPTSWSPTSTLDGAASEVCIERLVLNCHRIEVLPLPVPQV